MAQTQPHILTTNAEVKTEYRSQKSEARVRIKERMAFSLIPFRVLNSDSCFSVHCSVFILQRFLSVRWTPYETASYNPVFHAAVGFLWRFTVKRVCVSNCFPPSQAP